MVYITLNGVREMTSARREVLDAVQFQPASVGAALCRDRDRFGRRLYRPYVIGKMMGKDVRIIPIELGLFSSEVDAKNEARRWAQL